MYKSRLQELCYKKSWILPEYLTSRDGPDHNPRFTSTITVNGIQFQTQLPCRTAKEAQNNAAKLAFDHFSLQSEHSLQQNPQPSFAPPPSRPSSLPQPTFPQPQLQQPTLPRPSFLQPNLPLSFPQPSLAHLSFPQPTLPQSSPSSASGLPGPGTDVSNKTRTVSQPKSQEACQTTEVNDPPAAVRDPITARDLKNDSNVQHLYKNQLQNYAQKRNLTLPVYSSEREGPPHASRFKCKVTIDGQTYESPEFFSTLKDAEHAAAKVALMSLSPSGTEEDGTALYKNLLQELIQKEGFRLPIYSTDKFGEGHIPRFLSKVEVQGEVFTGQEERMKKLAEMSAAKVAYITLKSRKGKSDQSSSLLFPAPQAQAPRSSSSSSESNITTGLQDRPNPKPPVRSSLEITARNQSEKDKSKSDQSSSLMFPAPQEQAPRSSSSSSESNITTGLQDHPNSKPPVWSGLEITTPNQYEKDKVCVKAVIHRTATPSSEPATVSGNIASSLPGITNGVIKDSYLSNDQLSPSTISNSVDKSTSSSDQPSGTGSTFCRKITVYSRKTNVDIPEGGNQLPVSDENWVAYSNF